MYSQLTPHRAVPVELPGHYAALRTTGDGPVVLLVPGYTGSKEDFVPLLDPIADAGYQALAIDLPGQMDTPGPDDENAYLPAALGTGLAELVEKLAADGRPVLLVGHSFGGLVARRAVLAGAPIAGLTLLSSGPGELPQGIRRQVLELGDPLLRQHGVAAAQQAQEALNRENPRWQSLSEPLREFFRARFLRNNPAALLGMARGLRTEPDLVADLSRRLRSNSTGCLVACGIADDTWPPAVQRDMADRLEADYAAILGAGHSPAVEAPEALLDVLLPTWNTWLA
ncbi:alpha/beta hydrolase [Actinokineospora fastidiosa]|uniref:Alpha/beta hydrolase n=1 Tax=Actinokineospora fastidiosa TaxID=1816 RepID=A0A918G176_9PSEU|nr:2-succinyl-6-hydroxy-2,4-cyclohexadiene-1-carboxylate synthase [Actinokineospora sp. UTMC 2448]GGS12935.1 alpha/beta hydrolase [Actinokineospora fastidiosa]